MIRRLARGVPVVVLGVVLVVGVYALPSGAATTNPCKVLKTKEITAALGGTVGAPTKGLTTAVSSTCKWDVGASADRPAGDVDVHLMTVGAEAAYDGLKDQAALYTAVPQLGKALYSETTGSLSVLQGSKYLTVQGVFPQTDVEPQLIALMKIARKRI